MPTVPRHSTAWATTRLRRSSPITGGMSGPGPFSVSVRGAFVFGRRPTKSHRRKDRDDLLIIRKHAGPGAANDQPPVPEPAFAERARTLVYLGRIGSLSTLSRKQAGFPFGSVMPYGLTITGVPSSLSAHWPCTRRTCRLTLAPACLLPRRTPAIRSEHRGSR